MNKKSIAKNYIFNLVYQLLSIVLPLVTTPYLSRVLGAEPIGIYGYTISIVTYFILFGTLGISMYGQREIAYVQNDKNKQSKAFWEINIVRFITLPISMLIFYLSFCLNGDYQIYYRILLLYMISNMFDISWYLQGIEEFGKTVIRNIIVKALSLILIFVCVKTQNDLWKYLLIFSGAELLGNLTMWMYLPRYINKVEFKKLEIKKHIKPTIMLFIPQIATQIYTVMDKTMVGLITNNMSEVGYYEQAQKIVKSALTVITSLGTVMSSRIANCYANNKKEEILANIEKSFNFVCFLGIPIVLGIIGISKNLVPWFYGDGYEKVVSLLIATSPIILAIGFSNVTGLQYLVPIGKQKEYTKSVTIGALSNLILNIILIKLFQSIGAAIASVISEIFVFAVQYYYIRDIIKIRRIAKISCKYLISGFVMLGILVITQVMMIPSAMNTIIQIILGAIIYILILIILKDKFVLENIRNILGRIKK